MGAGPDFEARADSLPLLTTLAGVSITLRQTNRPGLRTWTTFASDDRLNLVGNKRR